MDGHILQQELSTYEQQRDALLSSAENRYVLISKDQVIGIFDTQQDAISRGYEQLGNVPFLVKQIVRVEPLIVFRCEV